jgi:hypothetical protein
VDLKAARWGHQPDLHHPMLVITPPCHILKYPSEDSDRSAMVRNLRLWGASSVSLLSGCPRNEPLVRVQMPNPGTGRVGVCSRRVCEGWAGPGAELDTHPTSYHPLMQAAYCHDDTHSNHASPLHRQTCVSCGCE